MVVQFLMAYFIVFRGTFFYFSGEFLVSNLMYCLNPVSLFLVLPLSCFLCFYKIILNIVAKTLGHTIKFLGLVEV